MPKFILSGSSYPLHAPVIRDKECIVFHRKHSVYISHWFVILVVPSVNPIIYGYVGSGCLHSGSLLTPRWHSWLRQRYEANEQGLETHWSWVRIQLGAKLFTNYFLSAVLQNWFERSLEIKLGNIPNANIFEKNWVRKFKLGIYILYVIMNLCYIRFEINRWEVTIEWKIFYLIVFWG